VEVGVPPSGGLGYHPFTTIVNNISYKKNADIDLDAVIQLYRDSTLGERRPVDRRDLMEGMMMNADLIITAWDGERLVGIARTLTDFVYAAYLADLAVHVDHQAKGIGTELIEQTRKTLEPTCFLTLLSAPKANGFYPKIGFEPHPRAWVRKAIDDPLP